MITERDLAESIAECLGIRNPNANTCIKLAAYYTIRNELFGKPEPEPSYSYAPEPVSQSVDYTGDSEFAQIISGRSMDEVWPVIDELMTTLNVVEPRLYAAVLRRLRE